jgi:chromosome segregation ATPase
MEQRQLEWTGGYQQVYSQALVNIQEANKRTDEAFDDLEEDMEVCRVGGNGHQLALVAEEVKADYGGVMNQIVLYGQQGLEAQANVIAEQEGQLVTMQTLQQQLLVREQQYAQDTALLREYAQKLENANLALQAQNKESDTRLGILRQENADQALAIQSRDALIESDRERVEKAIRESEQVNNMAKEATNVLSGHLEEAKKQIAMLTNEKAETDKSIQLFVKQVNETYDKQSLVERERAATDAAKLLQLQQAYDTQQQQLGKKLLESNSAGEKLLSENKRLKLENTTSESKLTTVMTANKTLTESNLQLAEQKQRDALEFEKLRAEVNEYTRLIAEKTAEIQRKNNDLLAQGEQVAQLTNVVNQKTQEASVKDLQLVEFGKKLGEKEEELRVAQTKTITLSGDQKKAVDELEERLRKYASDMATLQKSKEQQEKLVTESQNALVVLRTQKTDVDKQLVAAQELETKHRETQRELESTKTQLADRVAEVKRAEEKTKRDKELLDKEAKELVEARKELAGLRTRVQLAETDLNAQKGRVTELETKNANLDATQKDQALKLSQQQARAEAAESRVNEANETIKKLSENAGKETQVIQEQLRKSQADLDSMTRQKADAERMLTELRELQVKDQSQHLKDASRDMELLDHIGQETSLKLDVDKLKQEKEELAREKERLQLYARFLIYPYDTIKPTATNAKTLKLDDLARYDTNNHLLVLYAYDAYIRAMAQNEFLQTAQRGNFDAQLSRVQERAFEDYTRPQDYLIMQRTELSDALRKLSAKTGAQTVVVDVGGRDAGQMMGLGAPFRQSDYDQQSDLRAQIAHLSGKGEYTILLMYWTRPSLNIPEKLQLQLRLYSVHLLQVNRRRALVVDFERYRGQKSDAMKRSERLCLQCGAFYGEDVLGTEGRFELQVASNVEQWSDAQKAKNIFRTEVKIERLWGADDVYGKDLVIENNLMRLFLRNHQYGTFQMSMLVLYID